MSLPAALACLSLAVGMLLPRRAGLTGLVAREGQGGRLARRMLPLAFVAPAIITATLWIGVWMRRYPPEFVAVLLAISSGVVFFGLVWWYADTLDRAEARSRRSDAALRSSEAFYHSLVESLPQSILRKDRHGRFTFGNGKVLAALGITLEQLVNRTDFDFYPNELAEKYRRDDLQVLETGEILDMVEAHVEPGGDLRYVQVLKTPLPDHEGRTVGVQCIFWDVTERKMAEEKLQTQNALLAEMARSEKAAHDARKQAQAQMIQSAKLAGLGELVAGVAHEINNPLAFVNNNVAVLEPRRRRAPPPDRPLCRGRRPAGGRTPEGRRIDPLVPRGDRDRLHPGESRQPVVPDPRRPAADPADRQGPPRVRPAGRERPGRIRPQ
ncbi:MAG: PAS domain-containing protein [Isosphaeraceae bacterium]